MPSPEEPGAAGVFGRLAQLYACKSKADLGRVLGMQLKAIWAAMERGGVPYPQIVDKCPPEDWPYIFHGKPRRDVLETAAAELRAKGLRMILEPLPAPEAPRSPSPGGGS